MKRDRRKRSRRRRRSRSPLPPPSADPSEQGAGPGAGAGAGPECGEGACEGGCGRRGLQWRGLPAPELWVPVTPQMLVIAIKSLSREKRPLTENNIAEFVQERYPVREASLALLEVGRKLRCACAVGIALQARGRFRLPRNRGTRMRLNPQEVSAFWRAYLSDRQGQRRQGPPACPPDLCAGRRPFRRRGGCSSASTATATAAASPTASRGDCHHARCSSPALIVLDSSSDDDEMPEADDYKEDSPPAET